MLVTPVLSRLGQSLPAAFHSSTGFPIRGGLHCLRSFATRVSWPDYSGAFSVTDQATRLRANPLRRRPFQPRGFWTSHEPLYVRTTCVIADIARRRDFGLLATPELLGSVQNPLGVYRLPQDFTHRCKLDVTVKRFRGPRRGRAFTDSRQIRPYRFTSSRTPSRCREP